MIAAAVLLPSALRPPPDQATTAAEFSPDAPPDDRNQDAIFSSLNRAQSSGVRSEAEAAADEAAAATTVPPKFLPPKGKCYGDPPQQIESVYSPPCQPGFQGDNGGATHRGVTQNEIRIGFIMELTGALTHDGPIPRTREEAPANESANMRTYRVLQAYFNQRYEFYGRQVRFYYSPMPQGQSGPEGERARATHAVNDQKVFAVLHETNPNSLNELLRNGVVTYSLAQLPRVYYADKRPYLWSFTPDATTLVDMGAEYICKRIAHKPPQWADDRTFDYNAERRFGILAYDLPEYRDNSPRMQRLLKEKCNVDVYADVRYSLEESRAGDLGAAVTKLKAANVTTVIYLGDLISASVFTQSADSSEYFPEWFLPGFGGVDTGDVARIYSRRQWQNAFGFSVYELPRPRSHSECFRAYHSIDPDNDPDTGMCRYMWGHMVQLLGAIQEAGEKLNPTEFEKGQFRIPRSQPEPSWRIAGGYGPNDYTYPDYAAEFWWDPSAPWGEDGGPGSYRYIDGGKRYALGQWPTGDPRVFKEGDSRAPD